MNLLFGKRESVCAEILPLDITEFSAVAKDDGSFDVKYPNYLHGDFDMTIFVNGVDAKKGNFSVSVKKAPEDYSLQNRTQAILPQSGTILAKILANASPEERELVLNELKSVLH